MTITTDNQLAQQASGAADWDSGLNDNFGILERGYHTTAQAGTNINSGYVTWLGSGGFMLPYDPNSAAIAPTAISFTAPSSGESQLFLLAGIVRSMYLSFIPGAQYYVSMTTPGLLVTTPNGIPVGQGMAGGGFHFRPRPSLVSSAQVPVGGNSGDVLMKSSSTNYATQWQAPNSLGVSGGGGGTAGAHRWWGLFNIMPESGGVTFGNLSMSEIRVRVTSGGTDITPTSAFATTAFSGNPASCAIDSNSSFWAALNTTAQGFWFDISTVTNIAQITIKARGDTSFWQTVHQFDWMYSDDGIKFKPYCHVQGPSFTSSGQVQAFDVS